MANTGSAEIIINRSPDEVWAAITDITRMGEWSPECTGGRWIDGAAGPVVGARFSGDNDLRVAGRSLKKWTTTSAVTVAEQGRSFAFVAEGYTTWRYDVEPAGEGTKLTESFSYESHGFSGLLANVIRRRQSMVKGMQRTLERVKAVLEARP